MSRPFNLELHMTELHLYALVHFTLNFVLSSEHMILINLRWVNLS